MSTVKDNASVTSAGGLFKRFGRKRSGSFLGSPPTSPTPDSAPFLPPLDSLEVEDNLAPPQLGYVPPPRAPRVSTTQRSTGGPPVLDLPLDLGLPAAPPSKPTSLPLSPPPAPKPKPIPIVRGGPQLPPSTSIDTSLHLEVSSAGFLSTSRPSTPPKAASKPDPAPNNARTTSPTPSTGRAKSPTPHRSPTKTRKEPNAGNDKVNAAEKGGITKALGSFFKRSKTKEYSDTLSPTPVEEKRKSSTGIAALRRTSVQAPERKSTLESTPPTKANGVDKTDVPASAPTKPAASTSLVPTGKTFTTDDGEVRTFGEAAPSGGFARPAGYAGAAAASLRAEPEPESDPEPIADEEAFVLVPSGETLTTDDGEVRAFGEPAPVGGFARPAGFERKSAASLRAEPEPEPVAPVAEAAPSGKTFTTDDGAVRTFGEAAPAGGFARPAGFERKSASALRVAEEEPTMVPVVEIVSAGKTFTTDDGAVRTFGEPAPAGGFARPANAPQPSSVRALRAQFEQRKSVSPSPPGSPALGSKVATPRVPSPLPEPVVEDAPEAVVEEVKVEDLSLNGDAHATKAENGRPLSATEITP